MKPKKLPRSFYNRPAEAVAKDLLGKYLVHVVDGIPRIGKIVETEAYLGPHDLASHSSKGRTPRTDVMFGPPGYAYVYFIYGMHWNMNAVCGPGEKASAVLLRALEPISNVEGNTSGPARLCKAMGIDKVRYGCDLLGDELFVCKPAKKESFVVARAPRVGVDYAGAWAKRLLRFYIKGNKYVSKIPKKGGRV